MFYSIAIVAILILTTLIIGHYAVIRFLDFNDKTGFYQIFIKLIIGTLLIITLYSLIKTQFNTVHWGFIMIALMYYKTYKKTQSESEMIKNNKSLFKELPKIIDLVLPITISFIFSLYLGVYYFALPIDNILHFDEVFYSFTSAKMGCFGVETMEPILYGNHFTPATPYHYIELWYTDFVASVFHVKHMLAISVIVKSFFLTLLTIGMFALTQLFTKAKIFYALAFLSIFISPVLLDYENIKQASSNAHQAKLTITAIFLLWFILLWKRKSPYLYFPLLLLPIINIAYAPTILSILGFNALINGFRKSSIIVFWKSAFPAIIVASFIVLFYMLQPMNNEYTLKTDIKEFLPLYNSVYFKGLLYRYFANYVMYLPYFIPFVFVFLYGYLKDKKMHISLIQSNISFIFYFLLLSILLGMFLEIIFSPFLRENAAQLNMWVNNIFINILVFVSLLLTYQIIENKYKLARYSVVIFSAIVCIYNTWIYFETRNNMCFSADSQNNPTIRRGSDYIFQVKQYLEEHPNKFLGGMLQSQEELSIEGKASSRSELNNGYWFTPFSTSVDFMYISSLNTLKSTTERPNYKNYDLTDSGQRETYWWQISSPKILSESPLFFFYHKNGKQLNDKSLVEIQKKFILQNKLSFVAVSLDAELPAIFNPMVDTSFQDQLSGEKIYFFKNY